jgi:hypothetical protein
LANYLNDPENQGIGFDLVHSMVTDCAHPQNLGAEHPFTQTARNHLARFLGVTGHPAAASAAFEALPANALPAIGPEHPAVLSARDNHVGLQNGLVNPVAVTQALGDPLADCLRALGPDHTVTQGIDRILGYWYVRARFA